MVSLPGGLFNRDSVESASEANTGGRSPEPDGGVATDSIPQTALESRYDSIDEETLTAHHAQLSKSILGETMGETVAELARE